MYRPDDNRPRFEMQGDPTPEPVKDPIPHEKEDDGNEDSDIPSGK